MNFLIRTLVSMTLTLQAVISPSVPESSNYAYKETLTDDEYASAVSIATSYSGDYGEGRVYNRHCPVIGCRSTTAILLDEESNQDTLPSYADGDGNVHWHDETRHCRAWVCCDCHHVVVESEVGPACWCGWHPRGCG